MKYNTLQEWLNVCNSTTSCLWLQLLQLNQQHKVCFRQEMFPVTHTRMAFSGRGEDQGVWGGCVGLSWSSPSSLPCGCHSHMGASVCLQHTTLLSTHQEPSAYFSSQRPNVLLVGFIMNCDLSKGVVNKQEIFRERLLQSAVPQC